MTSTPSDPPVFEDRATEELRKEVLFWRKCYHEEMGLRKRLQSELNQLEAEKRDFTIEYGVEDSDGDVIWHCSPEDKNKTLEEQKRDARDHANQHVWFDLVSREVGPKRMEI